MFPAWTRTLLRDPRHLQIAVLGSLVIYGVLSLDFIIPAPAIPVTVLTALVIEGLLFRFRNATCAPRAPYESALISSFSTMLLLRSSHAWVYALAVAIAIASKTLLRVRGRHFINPTNGAVLFSAEFSYLCLPMGPSEHVPPKCLK